MNYRLLGRSGLRVSELALGTMTFGEDWGWGASKDESRRQFDAFAELGGNFIDTANRYTEGTSERFVGEFIASDRDRYVVATKYTLFDRKGDPNFSGNHRKNMMRSVRESLKRLGTDHIDLLWVHMWDFTTHVDEVMRGLDDLVRQGTVHYIGVSDTPAWIVSQANTLADLKGWSPFVALQLRYSLIDRAAERDLLPMARAFDLGVTPWSVLGAGVLSGKYNDGQQASGRAAAGGAKVERNLQIAGVAAGIGKEIGATPSQVAIAWAMQQPGVVIPILGARTSAQLEDNLGAVDVVLSPEHLSWLESASAFDIGFPHEFTRTANIRDLMFGGTADRLRMHR